MSLLNGALYLCKTEVKRSLSCSFMYLGLLIFCLLICSPTYMVIFDVIHPTMKSGPDFLADYMFILTFGTVGVSVTFIFGGFKRDTLADRLAYYRSLPISSEQIVLSKIISSISATFVLLLIYFIGNIIGFLIFSDFQLSQLSYDYVVHAIFIFGVMVLLNNIFIWVDLSISYKAYTVFNIIYVIIVLALTIFIGMSSDYETNLLLMAYKFSEARPIVAIVMALLIVVISTLITFILTTRSLKKRNLG